MSRPHPETTRTGRIELRASPAEKALLLRAAALERLDLTTFVMRTARRFKRVSAMTRSGETHPQRTQEASGECAVHSA